MILDFIFLSVWFILTICSLDADIIFDELSKLMGTIICLWEGFLVVMLILGLVFS